jgi:hypothetical protein
MGVVSLTVDVVGTAALMLSFEGAAVGVVLAQADRTSMQIPMSMLKIVLRFISFSISKDEMEYTGLVLEGCEEDMSFL